MNWVRRSIDWTFTGGVIALLFILGFYLYALERGGAFLRWIK